MTRLLLELGIDETRLRQASDMIGRVMQVIPEGENKPLYDLARESASAFLNRKRHGGNQDVILLDSVLSIRQHYTTVVKWVGCYEKYVASRNLEHVLETLANLDLGNYVEYVSFVGLQYTPTHTRLECAREFARMFLRDFPKSDANTFGMFRWVEESEGWTQFLKPYSERDGICKAITDSMLKQLSLSFRPTTQCGLALFQYLRMQCGEDTLKPDSRVTGNLRLLLKLDDQIVSGTSWLGLASEISKELEIRLIELDQILVCEDYLAGGQTFQTLLDSLKTGESTR
jgi:hypothetical protein